MVSVQMHMCNVQKDGEIVSKGERKQIFDLRTKEWCNFWSLENELLCTVSHVREKLLVFENKYLRLLFITKSIWQLYRVNGYVMKIVGRNRYVIEKSR